MPTIYGYKTTEKDPVKLADLKGTPVRDWIGDFYRRLGNPKDPIRPLLKEKIKHLGYRERFTRSTSIEIHDTDLEKLRNELGVTHKLTVLFQKVYEAFQSIKGSDYYTVMHFVDTSDARTDLKKIKTEAQKDLYAKLLFLTKTYPLMGAGDGHLVNVLGTRFPDYMKYIKLLDRDRRQSANKAKVHTYERVPDNCVGGADAHSSEVTDELRKLEEDPDRGSVGSDSEVPHPVESTSGMGSGGLLIQGERILLQDGTPSEKLPGTNPEDGDGGAGSDHPVSLLGAPSEEPVVEVDATALHVP
jgi:hypothetical protein